MPASSVLQSVHPCSVTGVGVVRAGMVGSEVRVVLLSCISPLPSVVTPLAFSSSAAVTVGGTVLSAVTESQISNITIYIMQYLSIVCHLLQRRTFIHYLNSVNLCYTYFILMCYSWT